MAFPLHSRPLYIRYHANRISCASFCTFLYLVCLIVLPYILTFALGGMWTKEVLVREQPKVNFRYEVLMEATAVTDVAVASKPIVPLAWSTSQELNDALRDTLRPCSLRTWEEDDELDGFPDRLQLALSMPVDADNGERVLAASVVVGVSVTFVTEFKLTMNASVVLEASSPLPGRLWEQTADLELRSNHAQRSLDLVARDPCPAPTWAFARPQLETGGPATASSILAQYAKCNDTVIAAARTPPLWTPGIDENFEARLTLRIPPMLTARRPGCALSPARTRPLCPRDPLCTTCAQIAHGCVRLPMIPSTLALTVPCHGRPARDSLFFRLVETLKLAFVQYIAFFIPISAILSCVYGALFQYGVVAARMHHPIKQHKF